MCVQRYYAPDLKQRHLIKATKTNKQTNKLEVLCFATNTVRLEDI